MTATLTLLIHGEAGTGKSWLADTAPAPRLVLDAEGRSRYAPSQPKIAWDPLREEPPTAGDWVTCTTTILEFDQLARVYQWLQSGQHCFRSVIIDSITEVQKRLIDHVSGIEQLTTGDWGVVLRRLESLVRTYRDLVMLPNSVDSVIITSGTQESDGVRRPLVQGSLRNTLPYFMDAVGYLYVVQEPETGELVRQLLVSPTPQFVAKDGTGRLGGPVIQSPDIGRLFENLNDNNAGGVIASG